MGEREAPPCRIRPAAEADAPLVLALIRELAEYERLAGEVSATEADVREALFGPAPSAEAVMAEVDGQPVGFALFFHNFSTFAGKRGLYLEDLYVRPEHRGAASGAACCGISPGLPAIAAVTASSGRCWTGTSRPSVSTGAWARRRWTTGRCTA